MRQVLRWITGLVLVAIVSIGGYLISTRVWPAAKPLVVDVPFNVNQLEVNEPANLQPEILISLFAENLGPARFLAWAPDGTLLVSITKEGRVMALPDRDGNGQADEAVTVISGLNLPHGLAVRGSDLFIAETNQVIVLRNLKQDFSYDSKDVILTGLPNGGTHFTRSLAIGNDQQLYVSVGSSCNVCREDNPWRAAIIQVGLDGSNPRVFASGLRNSVGLNFRPGTDELWATDNGRDWSGDDRPPEEVNLIRENGNYGWPTCYGNRLHDTDFDKNIYIRDPCADTIAPQIEFQAHSAPLGLRFYNGSMFPQYRGDLFVAQHGSWNRTQPVGYQVVRFHWNGQQWEESDFINQWLQPNGTASGRPVDIIFGSGGEMYISDDKAGVIYRVSASKD